MSLLELLELSESDLPYNDNGFFEFRRPFNIFGLKTTPMFVKFLKNIDIMLCFYKDDDF